MTDTSSKYEGLNLPQLLDLLHDLALPEVISWQPQTEGWWLLAGWLFTCSILVAIKGVQHWRRNRYRREALHALDSLVQQTPGTDVAADIAILLKRTALVAYPRDRVASLYGEQWAKFLVETADNDQRIADEASLLASAAYRETMDHHRLADAARCWIKVHRA